MTSEEQIQANRGNAQHSTGPRTQQGKAVSRMNATTHGILSKFVVNPRLEGEESQQELDEFSQGMREALQPFDVMQELLIEKIIADAWSLRRRYRAEAGAMAQAKQAIQQRRRSDVEQRLEEAVRTITAAGSTSRGGEAAGNSPAGRWALAYENALTHRTAAAVQLLAFADGVEWLMLVLTAIRKRLLNGKDVSLIDWQIVLGIGMHSTTDLRDMVITERSRARDVALEKSRAGTMACPATFPGREWSAWATVLGAEILALNEKLTTLRREDEERLAQEIEGCVVPDGPFLERILRYEKASLNSMYRALAELRELQKYQRGEPGTPSVNVRVTKESE